MRLSERLTGSILLSAVVCLLAITGTTAQANPVHGKEYSLRQPDGSTIQVRIWGDEYYQIVESLDGFTLVRDPQTQEICYARRTADGLDIESSGLIAGSKGLRKLGISPHLRPAQEVVTQHVADVRAKAIAPLKSAKTLKAAEVTGTVTGICILVDFLDSRATITRASIDNFCNQVGYTGYSNNGSVRDYFSAVSGGSLTYTNYVHNFGTILGYHRAHHLKSYYEDSSQPYGTRAEELITEALNEMNASVDFSQYDKNGDGYVDAVNCFYAGTTASAWAEGLWPHQGYMSWSADGVQVFGYQITDIGASPTLGTFCHENGHLVMGWPDLYDYDFDSTGVGSFCLMGYNPSETNPIHPCAPLKIVSGWGSTTYLSPGQTGLSLTAGSNTFYRYDNPGNENEVFVIENRQATGRDASLPDSGLAIWHVDTNGSNDYNQQLPSQHFLVTLEQADGLWHLEHNVNYGDANDLWGAPSSVHFGSATSPDSNWWDGTASNLDITAISASATTMTFDFEPATVESNMASTAPDPTNASPIPVTVTFSAAVTGFTAEDISSTNGTVGNFSGSGASYTFDLTPTAQGTVSASIAAGAATDSGGGLTAAASFSRTYDSLPPLISIGSPVPTTTAQGPVTFAITYAGATSISLDNAHVALVASGASGTASVSGAGTSTRTVTISDITGNGTIAISILAGTATDAAGNTAVAAGPSTPVTVDNTAIAVAIGPPSVSATRSGPVSYTVHYDNVTAVTLTADNITLNRTGTANASVSVSAAKAEVSLERLVTLSNITGEGTLGISIAAGTALDSAFQSAPAVGPSATVLADSIAPTLTLLGESHMVVEQNTVFTDPGATASDGTDGNLTSSIVVSPGSVDTAALGSRTLTYSVHDSAGNVATRTRTVSVMAEGDVGLPLSAWPLALAMLGAAALAMRRRKANG